MQTQQMPLNTPMVVTDTDHIKVTATRISEETVEVVYKNPNNSAVVLQIAVNAHDGLAQVQFFDKMFWTVTINGNAATEADLAALIGRPNVGLEATPADRQLRITVQTA